MVYWSKGPNGEMISTLGLDLCTMIETWPPGAKNRLYLVERIAEEFYKAKLEEVPQKELEESLKWVVRKHPWLPAELDYYLDLGQLVAKGDRPLTQLL